MHSASFEHKSWCDTILQRIHENFFSFAQEIIRSSQDKHRYVDPLFLEKEKRFLHNPDNAAEHAPPYHQWGILTHSRRCEIMLCNEVFGPSGFLVAWNLDQAIGAYVARLIDGVPRYQLLRIAASLHDIGKFSQRKLLRVKDGSIIMKFVGHEKSSGQIIRGSFGEFLSQCDMSRDHIEYVARCAELHYELAVIRREVLTVRGYTFTFARGETFQQAAYHLMDRFPDFAIEIGLLFLADSLAKTDIRLSVKNDEDMHTAKEEARVLIKQRGLHPKLINTIRQLPISIELSRMYLSAWVTRYAKKIQSI